MIKFVKGDIFEAKADALVNTINIVGIMGKGIALQFKERFKENFKLYQKASENKEIEIGKMFVTRSNDINGTKWIINFPTKKHWIHPSKMEYIEKGLDDLINCIKEKNIKSIAIPPLGCGNGGLDWDDVKSVMLNKLSTLKDVDIQIYEPSKIVYNKAKTEHFKKIPALTHIRAMILSIMKDYSLAGYTLSLLETQKLAYFLQRVGEPLKFEFIKEEYGPFASKLNHVLYDLDGFYITGMKFKDVKKFDPLNVIKDKEASIESFIKNNCSEEQKKRLKDLSRIIEGYETPLCMELLSTVDYVMVNECKDYEDVKEVQTKVKGWNERKGKYLLPEYITVAHRHLLKFKKILAYKN